MSQTALLFFLDVLPPYFEARKEICKLYDITEEKVSFYSVDYEFNAVYLKIRSEEVFDSMCEKILGPVNIPYLHYPILKAFVAPVTPMLRIIKIRSDIKASLEIVQQGFSAFGEVLYAGEMCIWCHGRSIGLVMNVREFIPQSILLNDLILNVSANEPCHFGKDSDVIIKPQEAPQSDVALPMYVNGGAVFRGRNWRDVPYYLRRPARPVPIPAQLELLFPGFPGIFDPPF